MSSDSEEQLLLSAFGNLSVSNNSNRSSSKMDITELERVVAGAVAGALSRQSEVFQAQIDELTEKLQQAVARAPKPEHFDAVSINRGIQCCDSLEVVKSMTEFNGDTAKYVSWRQAAVAAYNQFEDFVGSVRHYQAVLIIRNKIVGPADGTLISFATPLNFHAIISRLDSSYSDKTPLHLLEQQLSILRQGNCTVKEYYTLVESKLTLITNKISITYDTKLVAALNEKYRQDALRVFISGLKMSLSNTLFASRPADLPSALALAEELEGNRERYNFASSFSKYGEIREDIRKREGSNRDGNNGQRSNVNKSTPNNSQVPSLDVNLPQSQRQNGNNYNGQPSNGNPFRRQKINAIAVVEEAAYQELLEETLEDNSEADSDAELPVDHIHFLGGQSMLSYIKRTVGGKIINLLVDSGTSRNYITPMVGLPNVEPVEKRFLISSIHGSSVVTHKCSLSIFGVKACFFILPQLETFEGIVGLDLLKQVDGHLHLKEGVLSTEAGDEKLHFLSCDDVNFAMAKKIDHVPAAVKNKFNEIVNNLKEVFADPNEQLPFNTSVVATIKTTDNEPVFSKLYPYPPGATEFVNNEVEDLLKHGIIRKSRSSFNNPVWVVDKKGTDEFGQRRKRLVIDFRRLNDKTIDEKYPIPNITHVLSNLQKAKFFTTLDLKSGYHQLLLAERDRMKTAFSVNNGKYEFCRLPFGLKNAPSIFQHAIDDVVREKINKFLQVFMDDLIIYSETEEEHLAHIEWVLRALLEANMRVSLEKSVFFQTSVEYLGFVVSADGIHTCPSKVAAIKSFPVPTNLFKVRSFLGLVGYYRRFIYDFARIAKPLTDILRGDNGSVSQYRSKKIPINFNDEQMNAFIKLRDILASDKVILLYPDFNQPFDLTTDASSCGLGAVLSQNGRPITMISRTLRGGEVDYATNERELLAIVWALKTLKMFLYGAKKINIFTDHEPLIYSVSDKNCNSKIKRWKNFVDEHNAKIYHKPGRENYVADALSRQMINAIDEVALVINRTNIPINCYSNQIFVELGQVVATTTSSVFGRKLRHDIQYSNVDQVFDLVKAVVKSSCVNAIHCEANVLSHIQERLIELFPATRFWHAPIRVLDVTNADQQRELIVVEHRRAHRSAQNVVETVLQTHYFPKMSRIAAEIVTNCKVCQESKYKRHPTKQTLVPTPIPSRPGERIHIDIFSTDRKHFLTSIDKFSKYAMVQLINSRSTIDVLSAILQVINFFPSVKFFYCDNEGSFNSIAVSELLDRYDINISNSPPLHSTSNGQIERFHSTLGELARCLREERKVNDTTELIMASTIEYNKTIHTVIGRRPIDVLNSSDPIVLEEVKTKLENAQLKQFNFFNKKRKDRIFRSGQKVWERRNKRLGNKLSRRYVAGKVQADLGTSVVIAGRVVHKDNLK